ncbi:ABC transporter permease [Desulforhabdus sp. TSK]|uniref:ABC transporter permease n=1 Tax=Desulforhabdus sp. TSK TaxID=2925014 RepID=UPI001FC85602|nr:ABC transporter permease [Desulforhabdus sp. TSK]GKT09301.1 macrolide export ATP-binding/permease protein MacB [Desulforhabdus sp. TSK]
MELVELRNIHKVYQVGEIAMPVLRGVSLKISGGEYVALMGSSGSGKTTLMNILGCLDRASSGEYLLNGRDAGALSADERAVLRNQTMGFVFQSFNLLPRTSALENVRMPLAYSPHPPSEREGRKRAEAMLQRVGLGERIHHEPSQLSGGQQQRVAIARALINRPPILFADEPTGNLDSRTSEEVMQLFQELNREGVTIIMVTHDEAVARCARRIIRIRDGVLESEQVSDPPDPAEGRRQEHMNDGGAGEGKGTTLRAFAGAWHILHTAMTGLRRNILRAALTTLGIIIGVSAVIAMMEIGQGSSKSIQQAIASMGANNILILPGTAATGGVSFGVGTSMTLTPDDAVALQNEASALRAVAPIVRARTQVIYGNRNWVPSDISGTTPDYLEVREWGVAEGEVFSLQDVRRGAKVCLLGQTVARELFQGGSPLGKEVRINNVPFTVVGILNPKGANMMGMDQDDVVVAPWTTIKYRVTAKSLASTNQSASTSSTESTTKTTSDLYPAGQTSLYPEQSATQAANTPLPVRFTNVDRILAAAASSAHVESAIEQITAILRERHRIRPGEPEDFNIRDMTEMTKAMSSTATMMTRLLLAVALISLLVGGVGIMNIMLVSVTERTREIGLRMAVGAWRRNILQQFLTESVVLCFLGGAVGILVGRGASTLVATLLRWPTALSMEAILAAFAVSTSVGILFGYYPAWKASRLDPINALRYE